MAIQLLQNFRQLVATAIASRHLMLFHSRFITHQIYARTWSSNAYGLAAAFQQIARAAAIA